MRKIIYLENALENLVAELTEKVNGKKLGDRLSISAYYGNNAKLFRQSEVDASVCKLYRETGTALEQLPCATAGTKILFRVVGKEAFDTLFTIKENKPVKAVKAEPVQAEHTKAEAVQAEHTETVREPKAEYKPASAFEQVKALLPALTAAEKEELYKLLTK